MVTMIITNCCVVLYCTVCTVPVLCYIMQSQPTSGRTTTGRSTWTGTYLFLDLQQLYLELYISPWLSLKVTFRRVVYMKLNWFYCGTCHMSLTCNFLENHFLQLKKYQIYFLAIFIFIKLFRWSFAEQIWM